jgi:hypothetical protein
VGANLVRGGEKLIDALGNWPSFHDMNVVNVRRRGNECHITIHVWRPTAEVDDRGYFVDVDHHLATFHLGEVGEWTLPMDYDSDTLFELRVKEDDSSVKIEIESAIDPERSGYVRCANVTLVDVTACDSDGSPLDRNQT